LKSLAEVIGEGFRDKDRLVSVVARHLAKQVALDDYVLRGEHNIHPSEMSKENWCPRATFYRLTGVPVLLVPVPLSRQVIFEYGDEIHERWQRWFWEIGLLRGLFRCRWCHNIWSAVSPQECPRCESGRDLLAYAEVPVESEEYLILGSADGDVRRPETEEWVLIEIKSIGAGSIRYEAPNLLSRYTYEHTDEEGKKHTDVDWYDLWQHIRAPFLTHLRQGMIYLFCTGRTEIVFIYEPKFITAQPKEFEISFRREVIEELLEQCLVVKKALDTNRPPKRPVWADPEEPTCKACPYVNICWKTKTPIYVVE
jgi:hypothetical protein